ncbi:MAG: hypothetical protein ABIF88_03105 [archaeon]
MSKNYFNAAKPAFSFEKELHSNCIFCDKKITNPLCPECIAKGFRQWIRQFTDEEKIIKTKLECFLKEIRHFEGRSISCVACHKKTTHLCPYCFTNFLYKIAKDANLGASILSEFLFIFDFDFNHDGYSEDLEEMGGY